VRAFTVLALLLALASTSGCRRQRRRPPAVGVAPSPDAALEHREEGLRFWVLPDERAALREVLRSSPLVLGVGELHQKTGSAKVPSAIARFAGPLLQGLAPSTSDLIVETWVTEGRCGREEREVARQVEVTTERPAATENEVIGLLRRAKTMGVQPHILTVSCEEYQRLLGDGKEVDYEKLLTLVTRQLEREAGRAWRRRRPPGPDPGPSARRLIVLYGGALHNDRFPPAEELRPFSYAGALDKLSGARFVEVDLYVPEYLAGDAELARQPWFPIFRRHASAKRLLLIERGERSFILVFPKS